MVLSPSKLTICIDIWRAEFITQLEFDHNQMAWHHLEPQMSNNWAPRRRLSAQHHLLQSLNVYSSGHTLQQPRGEGGLFPVVKSLQGESFCLALFLSFNQKSKRFKIQTSIKNESGSNPVFFELKNLAEVRRRRIFWLIVVWHVCPRWKENGERLKSEKNSSSSVSMIRHLLSFGETEATFEATKEVTKHLRHFRALV